MNRAGEARHEPHRGRWRAAYPVKRGGRTAPVHVGELAISFGREEERRDPERRHGRDRVDEAERRRAREADHAVHRRRRERGSREHGCAPERAAGDDDAVRAARADQADRAQDVVVDPASAFASATRVPTSRTRGGRKRARGSPAPPASARREARCTGSTHPGARARRREARSRAPRRAGARGRSPGT